MSGTCNGRDRDGCQALDNSSGACRCCWRYGCASQGVWRRRIVTDRYHDAEYAVVWKVGKACYNIRATLSGL